MADQLFPGRYVGVQELAWVPGTCYKRTKHRGQQVGRGPGSLPAGGERLQKSERERMARPDVLSLCSGSWEILQALEAG